MTTVERIKVDDNGKLTGGQRVEVRFIVTTTWAYDLHDPDHYAYPELHDDDDAIGEITTLVREYLEGDENPFRDDYGPGAWGGYDGPFVLEVFVQRD